MDMARLLWHGGDPLPHPALEGLPYRAYPIQLLPRPRDRHLDRRLRGCRATMCGWVTVDPPDLQSPLLALQEEDGGGILVCDKLVIARPPLQVCAVAVWSPEDAGAVYRRSVEWLPPTEPVDARAVELAVGWLNAALGSEIGQPLGRPQGSTELNTPARLAEAIRQAMVRRMRENDPVTQPLIADDLHLSLTAFTNRLVAYQRAGVDWWRLLSEARALVPHTKSRLRRPPQSPR